MLYKTVISIILVLISTLYMGCEDGKLLGKNVLFEGSTCTYSYDEENLYLSCRPLSKIEYDEGEVIYFGNVPDIERVYDGDTIMDVVVLIQPYSYGSVPLELDSWPGIEKRSDGVYSVTNIRLFGIDTPEMRPSSSLSDAEKEREKLRAVEARNLLRKLIEASVIDNKPQTIEIRNPQLGTYAGRIVADVYVHIDGERINVANELIAERLAVPYPEYRKYNWGDEELDESPWVEVD